MKFAQVFGVSFVKSFTLIVPSVVSIMAIVSPFCGSPVCDIDDVVIEK